MSRFNQELGPVSGVISKLEIQKKRKDRINVHLDGVYAFSCHVDLIFEFKLDRGVTLDSEQVKAIIEADDLKMAYFYGLKIALTRSISIEGCRRKLIKQEFSETSVEHSIERLLENNYLDDVRHAQNYYEMKQQVFGRYRIQQELMRQGVDKSIVVAVVKDMANEDQELEEAMKYALRRFDGQSQTFDQKAYARIYGFLARKGYSAGVIRQVMDRLRSQSKKNYDEFEEFDEFE